MARILLVEDEVILAMSTQLEIEQLGHQVIGIAKKSDQAIHMIKTHNPDLILMDIIIQGDINGIELTTVVNREFGTPVVYSTAHMDEATIEKANRTDHCGILFKPFDSQKLSLIIKQAVQ